MTIPASAYFADCILLNMRYWQEVVEREADNVTALDDGRNW